MDTQPPIKDKSLATGQALFRYRVIRVLERHALLSRANGCDQWIAEIIREIEAMEIV